MGVTIDPNRIQEVLDACVDNLDRLSKWERDFIESVNDQFDRSRYLSEKQLEVLDRIYCQKIP